MSPNVEKTFVFLSFCFVVGKVNGEIFSAIEELEKLAKTETFLMEELRTFTKEIGDYFLEVKLEEFEEDHEFMKLNVMKYITNPLNAYVLIKRWTLEADMIAQRFPGRSEKFLENVKKAAEIGYNDLSGAIEGLLRLQKIYRLKTEDLANGIIDGKKTRRELNALDLFTIGEEAFKMEGHDIYVKEYLEIAWDRIKHGQGGLIPVDSLMLRLMTVYERLEEYESAIDILDQLIPKYPRNSEFEDKRDDLLERKPLIGRVDELSDYYVQDGIYTIKKEEILTSQVCRGIVTKSLKEQSELRCRYVVNSAYSTISPSKVEEVNLDPYIVMFVDVLTSEEIKFLKFTAKSRIKRGTVQVKEKRLPSKERIAKISWLYDSQHEMLLTISKKIETITGLDRKGFEPIQVQNYGIGGHYVPHWDHALPNQPPFDDNGNRIATMLFYLSDVEKGGETIFPYLKVRIPARKGSAAFWFNLKRSGESEYATRHAACPVLLGSKWVANKWIRDHHQEFRRPCLPEEFKEADKTLYYKNIF